MESLVNVKNRESPLLHKVFDLLELNDVITWSTVSKFWRNQFFEYCATRTIKCVTVGSYWRNDIIAPEDDCVSWSYDTEFYEFETEHEVNKWLKSKSARDTDFMMNGVISLSHQVKCIQKLVIQAPMKRAIEEKMIKQMFPELSLKTENRIPLDVLEIGGAQLFLLQFFAPKRLEVRWLVDQEESFSWRMLNSIPHVVIHHVEKLKDKRIIKKIKSAVLEFTIDRYQEAEKLYIVERIQDWQSGDRDLESISIRLNHDHRNSPDIYEANRLMNTFNNQLKHVRDITDQEANMGNHRSATFQIKDNKRKDRRYLSLSFNPERLLIWVSRTRDVQMEYNI